MSYQFDSIIFLGDTHGISETEKAIRRRSLPADSLIIFVGDGGEGFYEKCAEKRMWDNLNNYLSAHRLTLWAIRGNHSDPSYFTPENSQRLTEEFSNIELLPDYTTRVVNNEQYLFVGGAISVDRRYRTLGRDYWLEEEVVKVDPETLNKHDVVVAHTGPPDLGPSSNNEFMQYYAKTDPTLIEELTKERQFIQDLLNKVRPKYFYAGHFHVHEAREISHKGWTCRYRLLDIKELYEHVD